MTTPEQHRRISELFATACDLGGEELTTWLKDLEREDPIIVTGVRRLLDHDRAEFAALDQVQVTGVAAPESDKLPEAIGPYRVTERLGAGGMGVVYAGVQDNLNREIALKVVRHHLGEGEVLKRFITEAQTLARLDHPGIARVFEAGLDKDRDDLPWIAMELVRGPDLAAHCAQLDRTACLELFALVCDAVEHAHQRGVIHRDLKPSNVLIDEAGNPKVLDFGIARLKDHSIGPAGLTGSERVVGTLPYMSPEQASARGGAIGPAADVYSLGVLLFEILTGDRPLAVERLPLTAALRVIQDAVPPSIAKHNPDLRGDLEVVVARALEKDPEQRFSTASGLAAEVRRVLRGEPVLSRAPTLWRQLRSLHRRNRTMVRASALALVAVLVGAGVALRFGIMESRERERAVAAHRRADEARQAAHDEARIAQLEAETTQALHRFLMLTLGQVDPLKSGSNMVTLAESLDTVRRSLPDLDAQPDVQARVQGFLGTLYGSLGRYEESLVQVQAAIDHFGASAKASPWLIEIYRAAAWTTLKLGQLDRAHQLIDAAAAFAADIDSVPARLHIHLQTLRSEVLLAQGEFAQAKESLLATARMITRDTPDPSEEGAVVQFLLGNLELEQSAFEPAQAHHQRALQLRRELYAKDHPLIAESIEALASIEFTQANFESALKLLREAVAMRQRTLPATHPALLGSRYNLMAVLTESQGPSATLQELESLEALMIQAFGKSHVRVGDLFIRKALCLSELDRLEEAKAAYTEGANIMKGHAASSPNAWLSVCFNFGIFLYDKNDYAEALPWLRETLALIDDGRAQGTAAEQRLLLRCISASHAREQQPAAARGYLTRLCAMLDAVDPEPNILDDIVRSQFLMAVVVRELEGAAAALGPNQAATEAAEKIVHIKPRALRSALEQRVELLEELDRTEELPALKARIDRLRD